MIDKDILNISNYDKAHHIDREVCTLYQEKGLLFNEFINNNVKISFCPIIPLDKNWRPYSFWKKIRHISSYLFFFRLYRKLNTSKPDIIISDEPANLITQFFIVYGIFLLYNLKKIWGYWFLGSQLFYLTYSSFFGSIAKVGFLNIVLPVVVFFILYFVLSIIIPWFYSEKFN